MSRIRIEAFLSASPGVSDDSLMQLIKEVEQEYRDRVEIIIYRDRNELYEEYNLSALPALIVGELIRFIGVCPDRESIVLALRESGIN